ncbi:glyoxylate carboligase, partial [Burkholderia pseudomallei]
GDLATSDPLPVYTPRATRAQLEAALAMLNDAERPRIVSGGGVINAAAEEVLVLVAVRLGVPVIPTLRWGGGMAGGQ